MCSMILEKLCLMNFNHPVMNFNHPVKYISAPSLTKDAALKYSKCKIENIKDVSIFNFVRKTVMGGLSDNYRKKYHTHESCSEKFCLMK